MAIFADGSQRIVQIGDPVHLARGLFGEGVSGWEANVNLVAGLNGIVFRCDNDDEDDFAQGEIGVRYDDGTEWICRSKHLMYGTSDGRMVCHYCGKLFGPGEINNIDDRYICNHCAEKHTFVCEDCGQIHDTRRRMRCSIGSQICRPCFDAHDYVRCVHCGKVTKEGRKIDGVMVCNDCRDAHIFVCSRCGEEHHDSTSMSDWDHPSETMCQSCFMKEYPECYCCHDIHRKSDTKEIELCSGEKVFVCESCLPSVQTCSVCGGFVLEDDIIWFHGKSYCRGCSDKCLRTCFSCGKQYLKGPKDKKIIGVASGGWGSRNRRRIDLCEDCKTKAPECSVCGAYIYEADRFGRYGMPPAAGSSPVICKCCTEEKVITCRNCHNEIDHGHGTRPNIICDKCYESMQGGTEGCSSGYGFVPHPDREIHDHCYKPDPILYPELRTDNCVYYGFELEVDKGNNRPSVRHSDMVKFVNDTLGYTYAKHDGSLSDGFEIVSHPATIEYHIEMKDKIIRVLEKLRGYGMSSHTVGSCGLHIHASSFPITYGSESGVEKIIYIFERFWPELLKFSRRTSTNLNWAQKLSRGDEDEYSEDHDELIRELNIKKDELECDGDRYMAVNLTNTNTIEFRLFRGTLNPTAFFAALELVDVIVKLVINKSFKEIRKMEWDDIIHSADRDIFPELYEYWDQRVLIAKGELPKEIDADN